MWKFWFDSKQIFLRHWLAIFLAVIFGVAMLVPRLYAAHNLPTWQGIYNTPNDDEAYYSLRIREAGEGHAFVASPYLAEHKDAPYVMSWLGEFILGKIWSLTGWPITTFVFVSGALLKIIVFLFSYFIFWRWWGRRDLALVGCGLFFFGFFVARFNSLISPQWHTVFFLLAIWLWWRFWENQTWQNALWAGAAYGLLFHLYIYHWLFFSVFLVITLLLRKLQQEKIAWQPVGLLLAIGLIIGLPSIYHTVSLFFNPVYAEAALRVGAGSSHFPSGLKNNLVAIFGSLVFLFILKNYRRRAVVALSPLFFSGAALISLLIAADQNIITGKDFLFAQHYVLAITWFAIVFGLTLFSLNKYRPQLLLKIIICLAIIFCGKQTWQIMKTQTIFTPEEIDRQRYASVLTWLQKNSPPESVVLIKNTSASEIVPLYTHNNIWFSPMAATTPSIITNTELQERFFIAHYGEALSSPLNTIQEVNLLGLTYISATAHTHTLNRLRNLLGLAAVPLPQLPATETAALVHRAQELNTQPLKELLKKYRLDYIIVDKKQEPNSPFLTLGKKELFATNGLVLLAN